MLGVPIEPGASDSQDLNRVIDTLIRRDGLSLAEAMEMVVPPIVNEVRSLPDELHPFYMYLRQAMGPFAQGPVALIARHRDECVFSRRRARPAPAVEGRDARRLHLQLRARRGQRPRHGLRAAAAGPGREVPGHDRRREAQLDAPRARRDAAAGRRALVSSGPAASRRPATARSSPAARSRAPRSPATPSAGPSEPVKVEDRVLAGFGWQRDDVKLCQQMASNGAEPIGSLGYDGPLAALSPERQNLADYFKETVAVVTNPAIDREREIEHFSTRAVFGRRPSIHDLATDTGIVETSFPVILGGHHDLAPLSDSDLPRRSPASTRRTCSRTSGSSSATAPRRSTSPCSSPRPRAARSTASARRPSSASPRAPSWSCSPTASSTTATAATSTRTWRSRRSTRR